MALQAGPADGVPSSKTSVSDAVTAFSHQLTSPSPSRQPTSPTRPSASSNQPTLQSLLTPQLSDEQSKPWHLLPDSLLFEIFGFLCAEDLSRASSVCGSWNRVSRDPFLWRELFCRRWDLSFRMKNYGLTPHVPLLSPYSSQTLSSPSCAERSSSWRDEYVRLEYETPCVESEVHADVQKDEVLHVSFSPDGRYFATSSKDATVKVWSVGPPASVKSDFDMGRHEWRYTQFSEFNESSTKLLVSGVLNAYRTSSEGEVAIFDWTNETLTLLALMRNKPYDIFSAWLDETKFLSGSLLWIGPLVTVSTMCVNEMLPHTSSTPKSSYSSPDPIPTPQKPWLPQGRSQGPLNERNYVFTNPNSFKAFRNFRLFEFWNDNGSSVRDVMVASCAKQLAGLSKENGHSSSSSSSIPSKDDSLLIFTTGSKTFTPHQIGVKRIAPDIMKQKQPLNRNGFTASTSYGAYHHGLHNVGPGWNVGGLIDASEESDNEYSEKMEESREGAGEEQKVTEQEQMVEGEEQKVEGEEQKAAKQELGEQGGLLEEDAPEEAVHVEGHNMADDDDEEDENNAEDVSDVEEGENNENEAPPLEEALDPWEVGELAQLQHNAPIQVAPVGAPPFEVPFHAYSRESVDKADKVFEMRGHVIGLTLSPDHRLLFVNVRGWPFDAEINEWHEPPDISEQIQIHVIDLIKLESLGPIYGSHRAFTTNHECFFIFLSVSSDFVASGAEDKNGYIWDRRYPEIKNVATLLHDNVVNSIAFNPMDQEMIVSVSDDHSVRVWRSKRRQKEIERAGLARTSTAKDCSGSASISSEKDTSS